MCAGYLSGYKFCGHECDHSEHSRQYLWILVTSSCYMNRHLLLAPNVLSVEHRHHLCSVSRKTEPGIDKGVTMSPRPWQRAMPSKIDGGIAQSQFTCGWLAPHGACSDPHHEHGAGHLCDESQGLHARRQEFHPSKSTDRCTLTCVAMHSLCIVHYAPPAKHALKLCCCRS